MLFRFTVIFLFCAMVSSIALTENSPFITLTGRRVLPTTRSFLPRYSPDGKLVAFLRGADMQNITKLWVMTASGWDARPLITQEQLRWGALDNIKVLPMPEEGHSNSPCTGHITYYRWLPDSAALIFQVDGDPWAGGLYRINIGNKITPLLRFSKVLIGKPSHFIVAPNSKEIVFIGTGSYVRIPTDTYKVPTRIITDYTCHDANWGVDGRIYCTMTPIRLDIFVQSAIYAIEQDGKITLVNTLSPADSSPSLSPDGKWLAFLHASSLVVLDQHTGKSHIVLKAATAYRWLQDGRLLAAITERTINTTNNTIGMEMYPAAIVVGGVDQTVNDNSAYNGEIVTPNLTSLDAIDFSPDGKSNIYELDGTLYLMESPIKK